MVRIPNTTLEFERLDFLDKCQVKGELLKRHLPKFCRGLNVSIIRDLAPVLHPDDVDELDVRSRQNGSSSVLQDLFTTKLTKTLRQNPTWWQQLEKCLLDRGEIRLYNCLNPWRQISEGDAAGGTLPPPPPPSPPDNSHRTTPTQGKASSFYANSTPLANTIQIGTMLAPISQDWRTLAQILGLTVGDMVRVSSTSASSHDCVHRLLEVFVEKEADSATVGRLVQALLQLGQEGQHVVQEMEERELIQPIHSLAGSEAGGEVAEAMQCARETDRNGGTSIAPSAAMPPFIAARAVAVPPCTHRSTGMLNIQPSAAVAAPPCTHRSTTTAPHPLNPTPLQPRQSCSWTASLDLNLNLQEVEFNDLEKGKESQVELSDLEKGKAVELSLNSMPPCASEGMARSEELGNDDYNSQESIVDNGSQPLNVATNLVVDHDEEKMLNTFSEGEGMQQDQEDLTMSAKPDLEQDGDNQASSRGSDLDTRSHLNGSSAHLLTNHTELSSNSDPEEISPSTGQPPKVNVNIYGKRVTVLVGEQNRVQQKSVKTYVSRDSESAEEEEEDPATEVELLGVDHNTNMARTSVYHPQGVFDHTETTNSYQPNVLNPGEHETFVKEVVPSAVNDYDDTSMSTVNLRESHDFKTPVQVESCSLSVQEELNQISFGTTSLSYQPDTGCREADVTVFDCQADEQQPPEWPVGGDVTEHPSDSREDEVGQVQDRMQNTVGILRSIWRTLWSDWSEWME